MAATNENQCHLNYYHLNRGICYRFPMVGLPVVSHPDSFTLSCQFSRKQGRQAMKSTTFCSHLFVFLAFVFITPAVFCEELFHNGGTGDCKGCHTMPPKLIGSDASSTCLRCHQALGGITIAGQHYIASDPAASTLCVQLPPGGDFCWLKRNFPMGDSGKQRNDGDSHGHNIVALDYGFGPDNSIGIAPGGTYPAASLSCISCHDPHGNYRNLEDGTISTAGPPVIASGSYANSPDPSATGAVGVYRLLAGKGYRPKNVPGAPVFTADPPVAVSPTQYNRAETFRDTRVVYGSGMSEWCRNCHSQVGNFYTHPAGNNALLSPEIITNYNKYIFSGKKTGSYATAYTSLVPYEIGSRNYASVKMMANNLTSNGPSGGENVMCLSCHRAHASGWSHLLRWNMQVNFIVYEGHYPGIDNNSPPRLAQGRTAAETQKAYYDRLVTSFALFQRNFCNKCHIQD
jgi:hypothetical protein